MFHKIESVRPAGEYLLNVKFRDGESRRYDVAKLFDKWPVFQELKDGDLFSRVTVDTGGYGVSWNDRIDLSCDELYYQGEPS